MRNFEEFSVVVKCGGHPELLRPFKHDPWTINAVLEVEIGQNYLISVLGEHPAVELPINKEGADHGPERGKN